MPPVICVLDLFSWSRSIKYNAMFAAFSAPPVCRGKLNCRIRKCFGIGVRRPLNAIRSIGTSHEWWCTSSSVACHYIMTSPLNSGNVLWFKQFDKAHHSFITWTLLHQWGRCSINRTKAGRPPRPCQITGALQHFREIYFYFTSTAITLKLCL